MTCVSSFNVFGPILLCSSAMKLFSPEVLFISSHFNCLMMSCCVGDVASVCVSQFNLWDLSIGSGQLSNALGYRANSLQLFWLVSVSFPEAEVPRRVTFNFV